MVWVQQNIAKFGGNPDNVTLFGESAGAASVHIHALSASSRKYFHKAICQSGNAVMEWVMQSQAEEKSKQLAKRLGCSDTDSHKILKFLRGYNDYPKILKEYFGTLTPDEKRRGLPIVFKPNVELDTVCNSAKLNFIRHYKPNLVKYSLQPEAIIAKPPMELMKSPIDSLNIPIMMGYNSKDGLIMLIDILKNKKIDQLENDLARLIPRSVNLATDDERCKVLANRMRQFYMNGKQLSQETLDDLVDLMTDYHFTIFSYLGAELHAKYQNRFYITYSKSLTYHKN